MNFLTLSEVCQRMKFKRFRLDAFTVCISDESLNYMEIRARDDLANRGLTPAEMVILKPDYDQFKKRFPKLGFEDFVKTLEIEYTPEMFLLEFFDIVKKLREDGIRSVIITMSVLEKCFENFRIVYDIGHHDMGGLVVPVFKYDSIDMKELVRIEKAINEKFGFNGELKEN